MPHGVKASFPINDTKTVNDRLREEEERTARGRAGKEKPAGGNTADLRRDRGQKTGKLNK